MKEPGKQAALLTALLLLLLGACTPSAPQALQTPGRQELSSSAPAPSLTPSPSPIPSEADVELPGLRDAFKAVLLGDMEFINTGTAERLDITRLREAVTSEDLPVTARKFAVVDLDGDGSPEVILWLAMEDGRNDEVGCVILRCGGGEVYGYPLWYRAFNHLKSDGTFVFSGGAFDWGYGAITFSESGYEVDKITYCEPGPDDSEHPGKMYFVNHTETTAEEFEAAMDRRELRGDARWYDFTTVNIETVCGRLAAATPGSAPEFAPMSPQEEAAQAAYMALLSEDTSLWADAREVLQQGSFFPLAREGELEYATLDLDGDGVSELVTQYIDNPCHYNAVFHYCDGKLSCWNYDAVETSCWDYPLKDGTMVRQYDVGTEPNRYSHLYTLYRYQADGEMTELSHMFIHEYTYCDGAAPSTVYGIDGEEVDEAVFSACFEALVTSQLLDRSAWTRVQTGADMG